MRVLVVRGAGEHFSAGGDVKAMATRRLTAAEGEGRVRAMNRAVLALTHFPRPTLAMVDGLVNRVVPADALEAETFALARRLAEGPPRALALTKALLNRSWSLDLASALEREALAQGWMIASEDHREGLAAFFENRAPRFQGR